MIIHSSQSCIGIEDIDNHLFDNSSRKDGRDGEIFKNLQNRGGGYLFNNFSRRKDGRDREIFEMEDSRGRQSSLYHLQLMNKNNRKPKFAFDTSIQVKSNVKHTTPSSGYEIPMD